MTASAKVCPVCATQMPPSTGRGRPQVYCSVRCRRMRERELSRADRMLDHAMVSLQAVWAKSSVGFVGPRDVQAVAFWEREVVAARRHLEELLSPGSKGG